jgi:hypothetical protein
MKPGDDKPLREALSHWKEDSTLHPRFRENVWRRIAEAEASRTVPFLAWRERLEGSFSRYSVAISYVTILAVLGFAVGLWHGQSHEREVRALLADRYVRAVVPFQGMP